MKGKTVLKIDQGSIVDEFESVSSAHRSVSQMKSRMSLVKAIKEKTIYKGFHWEFKQDTFNDLWKNHPNLPIKCSNQGRVELPSGRKVFGNKKKDGYLHIHFGDKNYYVHRVIAETFLENPENKRTVDHIDRNRSNNAVKNLRWFTHKEQSTNSSRFINVQRSSMLNK